MPRWPTPPRLEKKTNAELSRCGGAGPLDWRRRPSRDIDFPCFAEDFFPELPLGFPVSGVIADGRQFDLANQSHAVGPVEPFAHGPGRLGRVQRTLRPQDLRLVPALAIATGRCRGS